MDNLRETRIINGQIVSKYADGAWYYQGSGTTAGASDAREVEPGFWFLLGTGVAVE